ncbi:DUF2164 domain-containing protein [Fusibacter ferrireducens]|uniref:DUF2164 domain-containing protein n=1 Tax=Fusibacter ferrireducens TaxID=2785058 RepID=A0ABR9ZQW4_9FIRM|nr:DUF2164 domain-containing protein [Fusibacter ferrireducens]MBF4692371.1 DUF2164 domain-containing protein [Fusibacter ferrireducens]
MKKRALLDKITLEKEERETLIAEIQTFFSTEREEELGTIAADMILDFFLETLGKVTYNKALSDSKYWFEKRLEEISYDYDLLYKKGR